MATSNNPLAPDPVTDIDGPGVNREEAPIRDIERPEKEIEDEEREELNIEFDDADALFGKRGGVKDSHDRY
jgi:hypothetical protein